MYMNLHTDGNDKPCFSSSRGLDTYKTVPNSLSVQLMAVERIYIKSKNMLLVLPGIVTSKNM